MRENTRSSKERFELSLDARQAVAVLVASLVVVAGVFVLGMSAGRAAAGRPVAAAPKDALARLDEPLAATEEPPPELKAHEALTAGKFIDKALPVPAAKAPPRRDEASSVPETSAPPQIPADATAAPGALPSAPRIPTAGPPLPGPLPAGGERETKVSSTPSPAPAGPWRSRDRGQGSTSTAGSPLPSPLPASGEREIRSNQIHRKSVFTIQVASAQRRADAERVANKLAQRGARVVAADLPGKGRWYRVQIGDYPSREVATRQLASLSRAGVHGIVTAMR